MTTTRRTADELRRLMDEVRAARAAGRVPDQRLIDRVASLQSRGGRGEEIPLDEVEPREDGEGEGAAEEPRQWLPELFAPPPGEGEPGHLLRQLGVTVDVMHPSLLQGQEGEAAAGEEEGGEPEQPQPPEPTPTAAAGGERYRRLAARARRHGDEHSAAIYEQQADEADQRRGKRRHAAP